MKQLTIDTSKPEKQNKDQRLRVVRKNLHCQPNRRRSHIFEKMILPYADFRGSFPSAANHAMHGMAPRYIHLLNQPKLVPI